MRPIHLVAPIAFALFLACSSGRAQPKSPPPPPKALSHSFEALLNSLSSKKCEVRPSASNTHWVLDFHKNARRPFAVVEHVGTDFVRLRDGTVRMNLPFSAIVLVTTD